MIQHEPPGNIWHFKIDMVQKDKFQHHLYFWECLCVSDLPLRKEKPLIPFGWTKRYFRVPGCSKIRQNLSFLHINTKLFPSVLSLTSMINPNPANAMLLGCFGNTEVFELIIFHTQGKWPWGYLALTGSMLICFSSAVIPPPEFPPVNCPVHESRKKNSSDIILPRV